MCYELGKAKEFLDVPRYTGNVISWVALKVTCVTERDTFEVPWIILNKCGMRVSFHMNHLYCMPFEGLCTMFRAVNKGKQAHNEFARQGVANDLMIGRALLMLVPSMVLF